MIFVKKIFDRNFRRGLPHITWARTAPSEMHMYRIIFHLKMRIEGAIIKKQSLFKEIF